MHGWAAGGKESSRVNHRPIAGTGWLPSPFTHRGGTLQVHEQACVDGLLVPLRHQQAVEHDLRAMLDGGLQGRREARVV